MKSEEIRGWIEKLGRDVYGLKWQESVYLADTILQHLHEEGVVIETGADLPSIFDVDESVISTLEYRKKLAGYALVEPLIEKE